MKDVKQGGVDKKTGTELYFNFEQRANGAPRFNAGTMNIVMRTTLPPEALAATIHQVVASLDPSLPVVKLRSMDDVFADAIGRPRLLAQLLGVFAGLALLLAAIGTYGVLSYMVDGAAARDRHPHGARRRPRRRCCGWCWAQGLRLTLVGRRHRAGGGVRR